VPVWLDVESDADHVGGLEFDLFFDAKQLSIDASSDVSLGADTSDGWIVFSSLVAPGHVRVGAFHPQGNSIGAGPREVARLAFRVDTGAVEGATILDIEPVDPRAGGLVWTAEDGSIVIGATGGEGNPWHNALAPTDVNRDGFVTALDALLLINRAHRQPGESLLPARSDEFEPSCDVDDDGQFLAPDILAVIHDVNRQTTLSAEGEGRWPTAAYGSLLDGVWDLHFPDLETVLVDIIDDVI
jgi:hypothetical protein